MYFYVKLPTARALSQCHPPSYRVCIRKHSFLVLVLVSLNSHHEQVGKGKYITPCRCAGIVFVFQGKGRHRPLDCAHAAPYRSLSHNGTVSCRGTPLRQMRQTLRRNAFNDVEGSTMLTGTDSMKEILLRRSPQTLAPPQPLRPPREAMYHSCPSAY
jgi:hypothetical protein